MDQFWEYPSFIELVEKIEYSSTLPLRLQSIHILSWYKGYENQNSGKMEGIRNQRKDDKEEIDNSVLVVGLYNQDPCIPVANFFTVNLPSRCIEDVTA